MKKLAMMIVVLAMAVAPVFGATFPTIDPQTLVSSPDADGIITVKAIGETGWKLRQFCQDNMRAGCGNDVMISPLEDSKGIMKFKLEDYGIKYGQVAFNFMKDGLWLHIPDCNVKTGKNVSMGMSYYTKEIPYSGGAHFVYTGSGSPVWSPVDSLQWCGERLPKTSTSTSKTSTGTSASSTSGGSDQGAVAVATNQSASAAHNSAAATNQSAAANNSSQANATSFLSINQVGAKDGKGKKGKGNTAIIYAPHASQKVNNYNIKGNSADVKVYNNKGKGGKGKGGGGVKNVFTYVGTSYQTIHIGVPGAETYDIHACSKCHSDGAKDDAKARRYVLSAMSSAQAEEKAEKAKAQKSAASSKSTKKDKAKSFLDGTPRK